MSLFARVVKTASGTMIRRFHVEQKGMPGAVCRIEFVYAVNGVIVGRLSPILSLRCSFIRYSFISSMDYNKN